MSDENRKKTFWLLPEKFTFLDYWVHIGVSINLIVVLILLWYGLNS